MAPGILTNTTAPTTDGICLELQHLAVERIHGPAAIGVSNRPNWTYENHTSIEGKTRMCPLPRQIYTPHPLGASWSDFRYTQHLSQTRRERWYLVF